MLICSLCGELDGMTLNLKALHDVDSFLLPDLNTHKPSANSLTLYKTQHENTTQVCPFFPALPASRVLSLGDGLLGSPEPRILAAMTLNSYSVQGDKFTTVAVPAFPSTSAGARRKNSHAAALVPMKTCELQYL